VEGRSNEADDVTLHNVAMAYGDRQVFEDLSCNFPQGKISVVLGGSGSGKSTVLRLIAGLVQPTAGSILVAGEDTAKMTGSQLFSMRRKLGMMFQNGALLDSMTVLENVALPLLEHA